MILLAGSSNPVFSRALAKQVRASYGDVELSKFQNDERRVWVKTSVVNQDVIVVQSCSRPVDTHILELALIVDAVERAGARSITVVIPWMGYSLQDKVFRAGEPIAARVVADIISVSSVRRVFLMDLHNSSTVGFFSIPTTVVSPFDVFTKDVREKYGSEDLIVVSPDFGGLKRAHVFSEKIGCPLANVDKIRNLKTGKVSVKFMAGEVRGKTCLVVDDIINTGSTAIEVARLLKKNGAKRIVFYATHSLLAGNASSLLQESDIDEVVVTDTVEIGTAGFQKLRVVSVVPVFAEAIHELI
ncbi:MAG TPA: ribose-phosphate pyrophosphokinase [Patescibacteria group bacterium]|nr:ribose-phosphate pyrophosphokinase [Patescibacteria group bacterium]